MNNINITHYDQIVSKFINNLIIDGNKERAENIFRDILVKIKHNGHSNPLMVVKQALDQIKPIIELKSVRIAGSTYQIPMEISINRQYSIAIKWIISISRSSNYKIFSDCIANEIIKCLNNQGMSIKKRDEIYKAAESNRAFAHYRW